MRLFWQSMRLFWQLRSLCWLISSKTYSRNIFIDFLLEAALTVAFFVWPVATIYTLTAVKFWFVRSTRFVNNWPMLLLMVNMSFDWINPRPTGLECQAHRGLSTVNVNSTVYRNEPYKWRVIAIRIQYFDWFMNKFN